MGMDVIGKSGNYFCNNIWWWHPLVDYIQQTAPAIAKNDPHWHSNDGAGLNAADSVVLADKLQEEIDSGRCQQYATQPKPETCPFSVENGQNFVNFLRESRGFHIW